MTKKKCMQITGDFDCHVDAVIRCNGHLPMEHIQGYTGSHWMPPSGKCLRRIAPAAAMATAAAMTKKETWYETTTLDDDDVTRFPPSTAAIIMGFITDT
jgi:hypothetical protein